MEEYKNLDEVNFMTKQRYQIASTYCEDIGVLDMGCNIGYGSFILAGLARGVFGYDIDSDMIEFAQKHWARTGVQYEALDFTANHNLGEFGAVIALEFIEHIEWPIEKTIEKLCINVKKGGLLILSCSEDEKAKPNDIHRHTGIWREEIIKYLKHNEMKIKTILIEDAKIIGGDYNTIMVIAEK